MKRLLVTALMFVMPAFMTTLTPQIARAQDAAPASRITGVLHDPTGAVVPGARVELQGAGGAISQNMQSGPQGRYAFDGLPAGQYQVTASAAGFATVVQSDIAVAEGQTITLDLSLALGMQSTSVEVTASAINLSTEEVVPQRARISDISSLLGDLPGLSLYGGGTVASLPVVHGMNDDRVNVVVNGMSIEAACSNHMNPPLSYVAPISVGSVSVLAGITPVSRGGDSIGGTISVEPAPPVFSLAGTGIQTHGSLAANHRTNGNVNGGNASLSVATENFSANYTGSYVNADNYYDGAGRMVKSTFYETTNHALQLAMRRGNHLLTLGTGIQYIPEQGFVNARMDMTFNNSKYINMRYNGAFGWGTLEARGYYQHARHEMNILRDKIPGMFMPMESRGSNVGYSVQADLALSPRDILRVGSEFHRFLLDDWWPPAMMMVGSMGPNTFWNVRDGRRNRFGTFVEWERMYDARWSTVLGVRSDVVGMNTADVVGYNNSMTTTGMAAYNADAQEFNARDHHRLDNNFDFTALSRFQPSDSYIFEVGYARKTRSPNLYERYLWAKRSAMAAQMNGWFGDANGYVGNLDLKPEVANTFSTTFGWRSGGNNGWELKLTPYYTRVADYIDVDRCPVINDGSSGCTAARFAATQGFVNLQFANHAARLYGVDASGRIPLGTFSRGGDFHLHGTIGYVNGRNLDTGDNLYQIMPVNLKLALEHRLRGWSNTLEFQAFDAKNDVQAVRNEIRTPGYALVNLKTAYEWHPTEPTSIRLDIGIDNLGNRNYTLPLGGRYWIGDTTGGSQVPGMGRTLYTGLTFKF